MIFLRRPRPRGDDSHDGCDFISFEGDGLELFHYDEGWFYQVPQCHIERDGEEDYADVLE